MKDKKTGVGGKKTECHILENTKYNARIELQLTLVSFVFIIVDIMTFPLLCFWVLNEYFVRCFSSSRYTSKTKNQTNHKLNILVQ